MKLVTWNVNSLKVRLPRVLELLEAHSPDVVMLQETKCAPEAFPAACGVARTEVNRGTGPQSFRILRASHASFRINVPG